MPISNYPNGFADGVLIRGVPVAPAHGAKIFYVGNNSTLLVGEKGASNGNKGDFLSPFSTIAYALTQCVTTRGDIIYVRPGHALTLTGTGDLDMNIANVSIIGLGSGASRPTITVGTAAAATLTISGASTALVNFIVVSALDGLNTAVTVTGADVYLDIEHQDTSSAVEADIAVTVTGDKPYIKIKDVGFTAGDQREAVISANGCDHGRFIIDAFGKYATAAVNFVTTACIDAVIEGYVYNSGTTDGSKLVVDTITGSTWWATIEDGAAGAKYSGGSGAALAADDVSSVSTTLLVPSADATSNVDVSDVVGNKTDAGIQTAGTTKSVLAYAKGAVDMIGGVGITTYPSAAGPANGISIAEVLREVYDQSDKAATNTTATLVNGTTLFTIAGGPIEILSLVARCVTSNDGTASTLQWSADPTDGVAVTISAASASLASVAAGGMVTFQGTTLATAPLVSASGANIAQAVTNGVVVGAGIITSTVGVGSTTGTWQHHLRYRPLARGVTVT